MSDGKKGNIKKEKWKTAVMCAVIAASLIIAAAEWILLPDQVIMQMRAAGSQLNTVPKPAAVAIPLVISVVFAVFYKYRGGQIKHLLISIVGLLLPAAAFVLN